MTVKEVIECLQHFDGDRIAILEVDAECGHLKVECAVDEIKIKNGNCILYGFTD